MTAVPDHSLLARLDTQPRVRDFISRAVASGRASHAYLFLGAPGSGKLDAAWALAQALLCERAVAATRAFAWRAIRIRTFTCWRPNPRPAT